MFTLPNTVFVPFHWIVIFLIAIVFGHLIFYTVMSVFGLKKPKRDYELVSDKNKFLFIVPAHNEESVIGSCLNSLVNQKYDENLFDVVCILDNCTDNTENIINQYPVFPFINTTKKDEPKGKPHALAAFFNTESEKWTSYDYVVFIDADNYVDPLFLKELNSQLLAHPEFTVVQGYLDSKNVMSSYIAKGYAAAYFITNRAVQYSKYCLGWNAAIGGTGFALKTSYLKKNGWNPKSYTEDFELQVELSIKGERTGWNHFAKTFDEKPNSLIASHKQRTRWSQGHWKVGITTTGKQILSIFRSENIVQLLNRIETLVYSYSMSRPIFFVFVIFLTIIDSRFEQFIPLLFSTFLFWIVFQAFNYLVIPFTYIPQEASRFFESQNSILNRCSIFFSLIICYLFNTFIYSFAQLQGFATWYLPQVNWVKTAHSENFEDHFDKENKKVGVI